MASTSHDEVPQPGLYQFADPKAMQLITQHQESKIFENLERGKKWTKHKEEYEQLYKRLDNLCDQTQYPAMLPIAGSKAFMPGRLENTNEIMVLLGDNWFADRSVKQAREICKRRIEKCDSMLKDLTTEKKLFESWRKETVNLDNSTVDGATEIREPYDESSEKQWREEHRQKVKEHIMNKKNAEVQDKETDEELWRRLDELEIQEELEQQEGSGSEDWSESPPLTDEESGDIVVHDPSFKPPQLQRRVSFGGVTHVNLDELGQPQAHIDITENVIKFSHSPSVNQEQESRELNPGHLKDLFDTPVPKSILKPFDTCDIPIADPSQEVVVESNFDRVREPFIDPVQDKIVEKHSLEDVAKIKTEEPQRKPSRFKLSRLNN